MVQKNKKRIQWLDNLRGLLILIVVFGHVLQYYGVSDVSRIIHSYIYSFHMPLFMLLSGFASYKPVVDCSIVYKRAKQLMIPYFIWTTIECVFTGHNYIEALIIHPKYWFLLVLFVATCFHYVVYKLSCKSKKRKAILLFAILIVFYVIPKLIEVDFMSVNVWAFFFFFYEVGSIIRELELKLDHRYLWIILVFSIPLFILLGYYYNPGTSPFNWMPPSFYFAISGLVGSFLFMSFFKLNFDYDMRILEIVGKLTLGIYVTHCCLRSSLDASFPGWSEYHNSELFTMFMLFVGFSTVSTIVSWCLSRSKYTRLVIGL